MHARTVRALVARAKHALGCERSALVGTREARLEARVVHARWLARAKHALDKRVGWHARWGV
jgi:hypothetical protein